MSPVTKMFVTSGQIWTCLGSKLCYENLILLTSMENSKFTVPSQQCLSDTKLISKFSVFSEQCSNALETGFSQSVAHIHL